MPSLYTLELKDIAHIMQRYLQANYPGIYTIKILDISDVCKGECVIQFQDSTNSTPKNFIQLQSIFRYYYYSIHYTTTDYSFKTYRIRADFSDFIEELKNPLWRARIDENWPLFVKDYLGSELKYAFFTANHSGL